MTRKGYCTSYATVTHTVYGHAGGSTLMEFLQSRETYTILDGVDLFTPWQPGEPRQAISEYRTTSHSRWNTSNDIKKNVREYFAEHCPGGLVEAHVVVHFEHPLQCDKHNNCCNTTLHRDSKESDHKCWCSQNLVANTAVQLVHYLDTVYLTGQGDLQARRGIAPQSRANH